MVNKLRKLFPTRADLQGETLFKLFLAYLVFSQLYYSYRYILGYGSTGTSLIVQDTPLEFQIPRYAITLGFYLAVFLVGYRGRKDISRNLLVLWGKSRVTLLLLSGFFLYLGLGLLKFDLNLSDFSYRELTKILFFAPIAFLPLLIKFKDSYLPTLLKFLNLALIFQIIGFVLVYLGLIFFGRSPAQTFPESMTRFGGIWDDPNALAFFLLIPLFTYLSLPRDIQQKYAKLIYISSAVMAVMIFMALSLTSWIIMAGGLGLLLLIRKNIFTLKNIAIVIMTFIVMSLVSPYSRDFLDFKTASLKARIYQTLGIEMPKGPEGGAQKHPSGFGEGYIGDERVFALFAEEISRAVTSFNKEEIGKKVSLLAFGRSDRPIFSENFYLIMLLNYGLVGLLGFIAILTTAFKKSWGVIRTGTGAEKNLGLMVFVILAAATVGLISLPYLAIFPVSIYIWLVAALIIREDTNK